MRGPGSGADKLLCGVEHKSDDPCLWNAVCAARCVAAMCSMYTCRQILCTRVATDQLDSLSCKMQVHCLPAPCSRMWTLSGALGHRSCMRRMDRGPHVDQAGLPS